jgi:hypothetical protein
MADQMEDLNSQSGQKDISDKGKPKKKRWLWWLGGFLALICLLISVSIVLLVKIAGQPLINAEYSIPPTIHQGDEFDLIITMENTTSEAIVISHFVLDEFIGPSILDGSVVVYTEPEMKIDETARDENYLRYSYFRTISPGETQIVKFHLRAQTVGTFGGPITAYADSPNSLFGLYPPAIIIDPVTITISP